MKNGHRKQNYFDVKDFIFRNFDFLHLFKKEFEDKNEKIMQLIQKRVS